MKVLFLGGIFPAENYDEIVNMSKGVVQYAADALQKSFIEGLGSQIDLEILNLPYLASYPMGYKSLYYRGCSFKYRTGNKREVYGKDLKFCNLLLYKRHSRYIATKRELNNWCQKYKNEKKVIVVYAISLPFLKACEDVKKKYRDSLKVILIVPDLPEFMNTNKDIIKNTLKKIEKKQLNESYESVDAYILLSEYMKEKLPIGNKPYDVIEGIFNTVSDDIDITENYEKKEKNILYTGTLAERYGVLNLVNAFHRLENTNIILNICGAGDSLAKIKEIANVDKRIKYLGQLPRKEILQLQKRAFLLVNPRTPEGEFTKYSFPSKTMEYLASGTPTLLYRLPGIPDEYYKYCFSLDDISVEALMSILEQIIEYNEEDLKNMSLRARDFIITEKNPISQTKKLINIINKII